MQKIFINNCFCHYVFKAQCIVWKIPSRKQRVNLFLSPYQDVAYLEYPPFFEKRLLVVKGTVGPIQMNLIWLPISQRFIWWVGGYAHLVTAEPRFSVHQYMRCQKVGNIFSESCSYMATRSDAPKIQVSFHLIMFAHLGGCLWCEGEGLPLCAFVSFFIMPWLGGNCPFRINYCMQRANS